MIGAARRGGDHEIWAPVSDLMAALMLIFMFIAVVYIRSVVDERTTNREECRKIYTGLQERFGDDFDRWDVELLEDLTIRFRNPDILFQTEEAKVEPRFERILRSFFPRYMAFVLKREKEYQESLQVLIEGHTSSAWEDAEDEDEAYLKNMTLSHARTQSILEFVLRLPEADTYGEWARGNVTATGRSSSRTLDVPGKKGVEDHARSRRVEFRLLAASCRRAGAYDREREVGDDDE